MDLPYICIPNLMVFESTYERPQAAMDITSDQERYNINYTISEILRAFRLLAIYDLLADRRINDGTVNFFISSLLENKIMLLCFCSIVAGSQMTSKRGRNTSDKLALRLVRHFIVLSTF